jgi:hypothetical protein
MDGEVLVDPRGPEDVGRWGGGRAIRSWCNIYEFMPANDRAASFAQHPGIDVGLRPVCGPRKQASVRREEEGW